MVKINSPQEMHERMKHWIPIHKALAAEELLEKDYCLYSLFLHAYNLTKELYKYLPLRKNGEYPFIHPLNTVANLRKAKVNDVVTLTAGLLHDYIEEKVDLYKKKEKIEENKKGINTLDHYEQKIFQELEEELVGFCQENNLQKELVQEIINITKLLTRNKRDFYFKSISNIFNEKDEKVEEKAIQIKLADRMHNILCIESFNEQERIYQCFKNIFILNNAKKFLLNVYGKEVITYKKQPYKYLFNSTERLFNKCCKATYDAFLTICKSDVISPEVRSMLQLSFKKFAFEVKGLWEVQKINTKMYHPMRLYYGVMIKYEARLHQEWDRFKTIQDDEIIYCQKFFSKSNPNKKNLKSILDYKDAFFLKEMIARLLYKPQFIISGFLVEELSKKGRIKN